MIDLFDKNVWTEETKKQWEKDMRHFHTVGDKNAFILFGHALWRWKFRQTINKILRK